MSASGANQALSPVELPAYLDMGIHSEDGTVWVPKAICETRNQAKMWALERDFIDCYIDARVRTRWLHVEPDPEMLDLPYEVCNPDSPGAFECWEIT